MRAHIRGAGLLLSLAATVLAGSVILANAANAAEDPEPFLAAPSESLAPWQELQIQGYCPDPAAGPLTSDVLTGIQILHDPASAPPNLNASGVIAPGATLGVYPVTMDCAGQTLHLTVTLAHDSEGHQPWALHGTTAVTDAAEPGVYPVSAACAADAVNTTITVLGDPAGTGDCQVTRVPKDAPETGAGPQELSAHGISAPLIGLGVVLGAAATAGAIAWRDARR